MTPLARRLGLALPLIAAGAAGAAKTAHALTLALRAGCRSVGRTEREVPWWGGGQTLDRHAASLDRSR